MFSVDCTSLTLFGTQKPRDYINCTTGSLRVKIDWNFESEVKRARDPRVYVCMYIWRIYELRA